MTGLRVRALLALASLLAACGVPAASQADLPDPVVVVLSWDGVRHDYPDRAELPGLARMAREGVRARRLVPVFPSKTFPTHVSMATGTYPDRHGIVENHFFDRERGRYRMSGDADWIEAEPLWIAAERQGIPAATYFWVGSESDWHGEGTRYRMAPFDGDRPEAQKVDRILEWLALPPGERPRLVMSYWAGTDHEGHDHGPKSESVFRQLRAQDAQLRRLLAGIDRLEAWPYTTLILVSDHGMTEVGRNLDLAGALESAGVRARVLGSPVANVYLEDASELELAEETLIKLEPVDVYRRENLPARMRLSHPTRTGDLVVVTVPPYNFSSGSAVADLLQSVLYAAGVTFGGHGYGARIADMDGVFLAMGRGVPNDLVLPEVHQVDLAPTVARLLRMEPPRHSEGRAVRGIGEHLIGDDEPEASAVKARPDP